MKRIHESWLALKPSEDEAPDNGFELYYKRISQTKELKHIPKSVLKQWIHSHYQNEYTLKNYAWINYTKIEFELCEWNYIDFERVFVIEDFKELVLDNERLSDFDQFCCLPEYLEFWKKNGTWKAPPIIIDLNSISSEFPSWAELKRPYQLVEGHSRFGYLHAMKNISECKKGKLASKHIVYLMKEKRIIS